MGLLDKTNSSSSFCSVGNKFTNPPSPKHLQFQFYFTFRTAQLFLLADFILSISPPPTPIHLFTHPDAKCTRGQVRSWGWGRHCGNILIFTLEEANLKKYLDLRVFTSQESFNWKAERERSK